MKQAFIKILLIHRDSVILGPSYPRFSGTTRTRDTHKTSSIHIKHKTKRPIIRSGDGTTLPIATFLSFFSSKEIEIYRTLLTYLFALYFWNIELEVELRFGILLILLDGHL